MFVSIPSIIVEYFVVKYLNNNNMTEIMWLTIFGVALLLAFIWGFGYLMNKIDKQRYLLIKFHELTVAEQNYLVNSIKTHFIEMDNTVKTIFDVINNTSASIVKENLKNPNLEPPVAIPNVKTDEKVKILTEQAMSDLEKLRVEFNKALYS